MLWVFLLIVFVVVTWWVHRRFFSCPLEDRTVTAMFLSAVYMPTAGFKPRKLVTFSSSDAGYEKQAVREFMAMLHTGMLTMREVVFISIGERMSFAFKRQIVEDAIAHRVAEWTKRQPWWARAYWWCCGYTVVAPPYTAEYVLETYMHVSDAEWFVNSADKTFGTDWVRRGWSSDG